METFIFDNGDVLLIDCSKCSKYGNCFDSADCVEELKRRLYEYEQKFSELELKGQEIENRLRSHPLFGKMFKDFLKG